jgi:pyridoxamine 5'-phosphate oxidase
MNIADLRKSYERDESTRTPRLPTRCAQFRHWFDQALSAQLPEPNAMTLATVGATAGRRRAWC